MNKRVSKPNNSLANQNNPTQRQMQIAATATIHQGPLPDPETLSRYDVICPGAAERILCMAENQAQHRQKLESVVIKSRARDSLLGIISAFFLCSLTIAGGTYAIVTGHEYSGVFLGSAGLIGLATVFIYGTRENRKERENKLNNLDT